MGNTRQRRKTKRYIFLDIDGVLNSIQNHHRLARDPEYNYEEWKEDYRFWDPNCVSNLQYLLELDPELQIILHSWWRNFPGRGLDHTRKCFDKVGLEGKRLIADTSHFMDKPQSIKDYIMNGILKTGVECTPQGVPVFPADIKVLVFDDRPMGLPGLQIQTDPHTGLTLKDIRLACQLLNIVDNKPSINWE